MPTQLSNSIATSIQSTYFDDFNESNKYYRILFRPSTAIQARELNQIQSILQYQVSKLGDYMFKDGSIVDGVSITNLSKFPFVRLSDTFVSNTTRAVTEFDNDYLITNSSNTSVAVKAYISYSTRGYQSNYPATNRWYLNYIQTGKDGSNNDINEFQSGDTLYVYDVAQSKTGALDANNLIDTITVLTSNATVNATGYGYGIKVSDGVIYQKGYFSKVASQIVIVRDYDQSVNNYVVGFETLESIVTENQDTSLNDNANGSSNYNAPGAHRLKLTPTLTAKLRTEASNNFFAIAEFENNTVVTEKKNTDPSSSWGDAIARRTFDESGDYVVRPFSVDSFAHGSNSQSFWYELSPGLAYVKGYQIEKVGAVRVEAPRATNTQIQNAQNITANFGNYVIVNEAEGIFDNEILSQVTLYDTAQASISDIENASASPSGSIIGYANVRGMTFFSGTKGLASAQYALYLFNIIMNSGKSFSEVRSFYASGTNGYAKADAVLEGGVAVLKDSRTLSAVFPSGFSAIKTLYPNNAAASDSSYVFRQISSATMAANGTATFNLDTAASGGTEKLDLSVGNYSSATTLDRFIITANSATYSANIAGSVSITSGSNVVTGSGTSFTTDLVAGQLIRVANTATSINYRVSTIANNTQLTLYQTPGATYATYNVAHYYPEGHVFNISSVNVIAGQIQFKANLGKTLNSSITVNGSYPVNRTLAVESTKDVNKGTFVKIDCSNNAATSIGPWDLGLVDVYSISHIYVGTTYANTNPDRLDWFVLDNGQRDDYYDHAKIFVKPEYAANLGSSTKMLIELNHFTANTTAGVGFFTVDSYPIDDANTANTTAVQTAQIPTFNSLTGKVDLRNAIDFRPQKYNTATVTTTAGSATVNPVSNTQFNITSTVQYIAEPDTNFQADIEYYLPRVDLLVMNKEGDLLVRSGEPAETPKVPFNENDTMSVAEIYVPAYPSLTVREAETYNRHDIATRINIKTTKRYTMRDISAIEERLKRVEYYVVLNALEQQAKDLNIPSAANSMLNRFKNGIFADPFNSHNNGNYSDIEYKIAIDPRSTLARPFFKTHPVDFKYDSANSTTTRTGSLVTAPYTHIQYIRQPFATKYRNVTESVWQWNGNIDLYPSYDYFRDEKLARSVNVNIDNATPWQDFANSPLGTSYGNWSTVREQTTNVDSRTNGNIITNTFLTQSTQQQTVSQIKVDTLTQNYDLGNYVSDFSINPYMRGRVVAFVAKNLKPNSTIHAFFDNTNVDAYCAPGTLSGSTTYHEGKENEIVSQNGDYGDPLVTDSSGQLYGLFKIPEGQFRTGDRVFRLVNVSDLTTGADAIITSGTATYSASSVSVTKQSTTLNVKQPKISFSTNTITRTVVTGISTTRQFSNQTDPLAQSFKITTPENQESGVFITKIGVYFNTKDSDANNGITAYVVETNNGYPDISNIVAQGRLESANVTVSTTGSVESVFVLDQPVMATSNKEYAFILYPDGNSPEWTVWTAETGGVDINTGENVYSNPYSGIMFVSSNMTAWTPIQKEDIKFNIYRASFSTGNFYAYFHNENDEYLTTGGFTRANSSVAVEIGDVVYSANSTGGPNTAANAAYGVIQYIDEADGILYLDSSTNGKFYAGNNINVYRVSDPSNTSLITNTYLIANATISTVDNLAYHAVVPKFASIQPVQTSIAYQFQGTDGSYVKDTSYTNVIGETETEYLDKTRYAVSKSNEVASMSSAKSSTFKITMGNSSTVVTPAIDLSRKASLFIENVINNDSTNEHTKYGNASTKYVSKNIVLADGQEAEDLKVFLTAYRPVNTDIKVYAKFYNISDPDTFDSKVWTELSYLNDGDLTYSNPADRSDFYEYEFGVPSTAPVTYGGYLDGTNSSILTYVNPTGSKFVGFKIFALKIVLLSSNSVRIPLLNDVRAIALQV